MKDARLIGKEEIVSAQKRFIHETLAMPDGAEIDWYYLDTPNSVMIVPITQSGNVVLVRQYRYNLKQYTLELPAGTPGKDEEVRAAAMRELYEETGYVEDSESAFTGLGRFYVLPSETNRYVNIFLAAPVKRSGRPPWDNQIEKYFDMSIVEMPFRESLLAIGKGLLGIETISALLIAQEKVGAIIDID